ncbi:MAG: regulatory protein GemA [Rhodospirillaceae bacterium]
MIDNKKIALIRVAKSQLGLNDDDYRAVLKRCGNVDSSKDLDLTGFKAVMSYFEQCGFKSTSKKRNFGNRPGMATEKQVVLIRKLWGDFTGGTGTDVTLGKWLDRTFKVSSIRFVNAETARKAIGALTAMARKTTAGIASGASAPGAV